MKPYRTRVFIEEPGLYRAQGYFWGCHTLYGWGDTPAQAIANMMQHRNNLPKGS